MGNMVETPKKLTGKQLEQQEAKERLLKLVKPGDTVLTVLKHTSRSGMMRHIKVAIVHKGEVLNITHDCAILLDDRIADDGGIKVGGCGMDMGYHLVYSLSSALFRGQFKCIGEGCPANDHSNSPYPKRKAESMTHTDAGYALRQRWF